MISFVSRMPHVEKSGFRAISPLSPEWQAPFKWSSNVYQVTNSTTKEISIRYTHSWPRFNVQPRRRWRVRPARAIFTFRLVALHKRTQLSKICIARQMLQSDVRATATTRVPTRVQLSSCPSHLRRSLEAIKDAACERTLTRSHRWHFNCSTIASRVSLSQPTPSLLRFVCRAMFITSV